MLHQNVAEFLRKAREDSSLAEQVRNTDSYEGLSGLSRHAGSGASAQEFEAAFAARNARVLAQQMIRTGLIEPADLPAPQARNAEVLEAVQELNLEPVITQLTNRKEWDPGRAAAAVRRYRGFLYLKAADVVETLVPTSEVDEIWHQHILNTKQYASDCQRLLGEFLHHSPTSGVDPNESLRLQDPYFHTWVAYESLFGEPYEETIGAALLNRWPAAGAA
ncbi:MAG: hypothetical protein C5B51_06990 [Terriglobia bacterium]|nr:MAG: hypothetical protein C5B51_06990 [Terriglobia bacterium]